MPVTIDGTNGITTPTYGGSDTSEYLVPVTAFKNRIINGAMQIDQRNAEANFIGTGYSADRWYIEDGCDAVLSTQKTTDVPSGAGFVNSLKVTATTADASIGSTQFAAITQFIEGLNIADFMMGTASAVSFAVSFWVKASVAGQYSCAVTNNGATRINPQAFTINSSDTWEQKTVTFTGDTSGTWLTNNGRGIILSFYMALGSSYLGSSGWNGSSIYGITGQANALASTNNIFAITGVQLEKGSTATSFDYRPYGTELALCQRYYYRIGGGTGSSATATRSVIGYGFTSTTTNTSIVVSLPVTMRSTPTVNFGGTLTVSGSGYAATPTDVTLNNGANASCVDLVFIVATTTAALPRSATVRTDTDPDAFVDFSAEL